MHPVLASSSVFLSFFLLVSEFSAVYPSKNGFPLFTSCSYLVLSSQILHFASTLERVFLIGF